VLLSFALGDKIRIEQEEARKSIEELNNSLERKVEEKTRELSQANRKLTDLDRQKTSFFQNISHEIRTPLTLILNPLENAPTGYPTDKFISTALRNSKRLFRLVNQLLDFQKYSGAGKTFQMISVNMTELILSIGDYFRETAEKKKIKFILKIDDELHGGEKRRNFYISGQTDALEKIIFNYLSNALKFVRENGTITLKLACIEKEVVVSVTDDGIGISGENQKKLFKLFSQVDDSNCAPYEGTGLGLALTKELTEKMNGWVDVISRIGEGSCFVAAFPLLKIEKPRIGIIIALNEARFQNEVAMAAASKFDTLPSRIVTDLLEVEKITRDYDACGLITDDTMLGLYGNRAIKKFNDDQPGAKIFIARTCKNAEPYPLPAVQKDCLREIPFGCDAVKAVNEIHEILTFAQAEKNQVFIQKQIKDWHLADDRQDMDGIEENTDNSGVSGTGNPLMGSILVVEDMIDMLHFLTNFLRSGGYCVTGALNGKEALQRCNERKPDLIITDWMMPVMSGPELIRHIKSDANLSPIPVILLTAKSDESNRKEGIHQGADGFLGKPFDQLELISLVRNLLKLKHGERQIAMLTRQIADDALRRFIPPELVKRVMDGEAVFDDKPRYTSMTIMIVSLTHLKENFDAVGARGIAALLNEYYSEMTPIIFENNGIVDRFDDCSIKVLFGICPAEENAESQIRSSYECALRIDQKLSGLIGIWNMNLETPLNFKIAIHHGEAVLGTLGSKLRSDYTATGPGVIIAKKMEEFAKDGEILISKTARDYLDENMWSNQGRINIDGSGQTLVISKVVKPGTLVKKAV
ncbi:MAG: response regulator, partial [Oligoflexales bacterium]|nr:response regulator [Oligoflexales bacterium]